MIAAKRVTQHFSLEGTIAVLVLAGGIALSWLFVSQARPASPGDVREAVLECSSVRKEVESTGTPFTKRGLQKVLDNCLAVELQKSGLPK